MEGLVRWTLDQAGNDDVRSVNALVGETNDGGLNDIRGQHVRPQHVLEALKAATRRARSGGQRRRRHRHAGVRMEGRHRHRRRASSTARYGGYTVGVLVQSNYGGVLTMGGAPVGRSLGRYAYQADRRDRRTGRQGRTIAATGRA